MIEEATSQTLPDVVVEWEVVAPSGEPDPDMAVSIQPSFESVRELVKNSPPPRRPNRNRPLNKLSD